MAVEFAGVVMGATSRPCEPVGTDWPAVTDPTPAPPTNP